MNPVHQLNPTPRDLLLLRLAEQPDTLEDVVEIVNSLLSLSKDPAIWTQLPGPDNNHGMLDVAPNGWVLLKELLTNAQDAFVVLWTLFISGALPFKTPEEVVAKMGFTDEVMQYPTNPKRNGPDADPKEVTEGSDRVRGQADKISLSILDGSGKPIVEVVDRASGIPVSKIPETVLNIGTSEKIGIHYLAGSYGFGLKSLYPFAKYTLIITRAHKSYRDLVGDTNGDEVAVTLVSKVGGQYKYLSDAQGEILTLPASMVRERVPGSILESGSWKMQPFQYGTRIVFYNYDLGRYNKLSDASNNRLHRVLNTYMYRPMLPYTFYECRELKYHIDRLNTARKMKKMWPSQPKGKQWRPENMTDPEAKKYAQELRDFARNKLNSEDAIDRALLSTYKYLNDWKSQRALVCRGVGHKVVQNIYGNTVYTKHGTVKFYCNDTEREEVVHTTLHILKKTNEEFGGFKAKRKVYKNKKGRKNLKDPVESYVENHRTVLFTYHGSTHGSNTSSFFNARGMNTGHLTGRALLEIRLDNLSRDAFQSLTVGTRAGLREDTEVYKGICAGIRDWIRSLDRVTDLNKESRAKVLDSKVEISDLNANIKERLKAFGVKARKTTVTPDPKKPPEPWPLSGGKPNTHLTEIVVTNKPPLRLKPGNRFTITFASDAPDGTQIQPSDIHLFKSPSFKATVLSTAHFENGHASVLFEWDNSLPRETEGVIHITVNGVQVADPLKFKVPKKNTKPPGNPGKDGNEVSEEDGDPDLKIIAVSKDGWENASMDKDTVGHLLPAGPNAWEAIINTDNALLHRFLMAKRKGGRIYTKKTRERMLHQYCQHMGILIYSTEQGVSEGYAHRKYPEGEAGGLSTRTERDKQKDYTLALRAFMSTITNIDPDDIDTEIPGKDTT